MSTTPTRATAATKDIIVFDKVNKWYGNSFHVLRDINLNVKQGERIVICGPSGSGKSTLIRCINRLEEHQEGHLFVDGTELTDDVKAVAVPLIDFIENDDVFGGDRRTGGCGAHVCCPRLTQFGFVDLLLDPQAVAAHGEAE